ncbi:TraK domain-containing protein [Ferrimonas kyonanensis]|uniref:TraK domain-containing protein n=1 Tax=Ferrimonas kyonanensis TaxID=364763 RepID=UPI00040941E7|nr:type-F conjugative transfer system secretin TraK [Ferrimonas kyonanensis]
MKHTITGVALALIGALSQANPLPVEIINPGKLENDAALIEQVQGTMAQKYRQQTGPTPPPITVPPTTEMEKLLNRADPTRLANEQTFMPAQPTMNSFSQMLDKAYRPKHDLPMKPGDNMVIPVAGGLMNRIQTNYQVVAVRTHDESSIIEVEDGIIYITINSTQPVGLLMYEEGVPESAINLTLVPQQLKPPVLINAHIDISDDMVAKGAQFQAELEKQRLIDRAAQSERSNPFSNEYTNFIKSAMRGTGLGNIPAGFSLSEDVSGALAKPCAITIHQEVGQRLVGTRSTIDVVLVRNDSLTPYTVREEMCITRDVQAVSILNHALLQPGEMTEVYILRHNQSEMAPKHKVRPRLTDIAGG